MWTGHGSGCEWYILQCSRMAEILDQPEVMKNAQQELEAVVGRGNIVEESHIHKLP